MLVHESRILQVTLFETLQDNLRFLNVSLLLTDVATIADEVDAQLAQSMDSFMNAMRQARSMRLPSCSQPRSHGRSGESANRDSQLCARQKRIDSRLNWKTVQE